MVWFSRAGPLSPMPTCSSPNWALASYPRLASRPTPFWLMPYVPTSFQLEDLFRSNKLPRETAQSGGTVAKTDGEQPNSDTGTRDSGEAVDTSTRMYCSGVPTLRSNVLHGPSLPSLRSAVSLQHGSVALDSGTRLQVFTRWDHKRPGVVGPGNRGEDRKGPCYCGRLHFGGLTSVVSECKDVRKDTGT